MATGAGTNFGGGNASPNMWLPTPAKRPRKLGVSELMGIQQRGGPQMSTATDPTTGERLTNEQLAARGPLSFAGWNTRGMYPGQRIGSAAGALGSSGIPTSQRGKDMKYGYGAGAYTTNEMAQMMNGLSPFISSYAAAQDNTGTEPMVNGEPATPFTPIPGIPSALSLPPAGQVQPSAPRPGSPNRLTNPADVQGKPIMQGMGGSMTIPQSPFGLSPLAVAKPAGNPMAFNPPSRVIGGSMKEPGVPMLAHGGAVPHGTPFIAGDPQKNGKPNPEVIIPTPQGIHVMPLQNLPKYAYGTGPYPYMGGYGGRYPQRPYQPQYQQAQPQMGIESIAALIAQNIASRQQQPAQPFNDAESQLLYNRRGNTMYYPTGLTPEGRFRDMAMRQNARSMAGRAAVAKVQAEQKAAVDAEAAQNAQLKEMFDVAQNGGSMQITNPYGNASATYGKPASNPRMYIGPKGGAPLEGEALQEVFQRGVNAGSPNAGVGRIPKPEMGYGQTDAEKKNKLATLIEAYRRKNPAVIAAYRRQNPGL